MSTASSEATSAAWEGASPSISVVVPTHNRAHFLTEIVFALEAQTFPIQDFEVVFVDDASTDGTPDRLRDLARKTPLRLKAVRMDTNGGPAGARNVGTSLARGTSFAFTDDDCLPSTVWLEALARCRDDGSDLIQGRTLPQPGSVATAWPRYVWVTRPSGLFESCNLAVTRKAFEEAGGFGMDRPGIPAGTRAHFGEDVEMGWRIRTAGRRTSYCPGALVHHRQLPATYLEWLGEHRRMALFPGLVRRVPGLGRELLRFHVFLSDRTALFDLAAAGVALAVALRRPWLAAASLPWLRARWREAGWRGGTRPLRVVQLALGDVVGLASLVQGSARSGRLVL